jgi:hypothetical protein
VSLIAAVSTAGLWQDFLILPGAVACTVAASLTILTIPTVLIPLWNSFGTDVVPNCKPLDNRLF